MKFFLFLTLFFFKNLYAELPLSNPKITMRTFIEAMDKVKRGSRSGFSEAIATLDLSKIELNSRSIYGKMTAEKLINTLDRMSPIDYNAIPENSNGPKWIFRKQTLNHHQQNTDVEISIAKTPEGFWKFTPETVASIDPFYSSVAHLDVAPGIIEYRNWKMRFKELMPDWTAEPFLTLKKGQWLGLLFLALNSYFILGLVRFFITLYIRHKVVLKSIEIDKTDQFKSTASFGYLALSLTWFLGIRLFEFEGILLSFFLRISYIMTAIFSVWSALKLVDYFTLYFEKKSTNKFNEVLVPMLKKTAKVLVVSFGILLVAHSLTFDIASILAGLGIGGVAIALAAKDTISNLFGSVTVLIDRPFEIGDYISLDKNLEGSVEQVGFRSTRLRTPSNSLVTLPNSVLANMAIDNFGMRKARRYKTVLQIGPSTQLALIEDFCERLRYHIQLNPLIQKETAVVSLYDITRDSLEVMVVVFFLTDKSQEELSERQKFIMEILKTAEFVGVKFSPPLST